MEGGKENQIKVLQEKLESIKAKDIMTTEVTTAPEDLHLAEIANFMIKKRISGLPVVRAKDQLVGMITTTDLFTLIDIIRSGVIKEDALNPKVSFAMSTDIITIDKETTLDRIIDIIKRRNIHTIPIYEDGKMIGIVGRRDILKKFYSVAESIATN